MSGAAASPQPTVTAEVVLNGPGWKFSLQVAVPNEPTHLRQMLPLAQALADRVLAATASALAENGKPVSCRKGCGACCRQLVTLSEVEAHHLEALVEALPEPRRTQLRGRFAAARTRLEQAGLLAALQQPHAWTPEFFRTFALDYFRQGIACPFLEEESCTIYPQRPLRCREFLVTSPAEHCCDPRPETVDVVEVPVKTARALARFHGPSEGPYLERYVPLILALEWAEQHPEETATRPAPGLFEELIGHLGGSPRPGDVGQLPASTVSREAVERPSPG